MRGRLTVAKNQSIVSSSPFTRLAGMYIVSGNRPRKVWTNRQRTEPAWRPRKVSKCASGSGFDLGVKWLHWLSCEVLERHLDPGQRTAQLNASSGDNAHGHRAATAVTVRGGAPDYSVNFYGRASRLSGDSRACRTACQSASSAERE